MVGGERGPNTNAPDGGWGWFVVFGSFMIQFLTIGVTYTFGILLVVMLDYFHESRSSTAWIGSIQTALLYATGIITGPLIKRAGWRQVTFIGCLVSVIGFVTSSLVPNMYLLYLTYGVLTGIGNGLMYMTSMVVVQHYFDEKRAMATGISVAGSGAGTLAFGFITQALLDKVGWRWTLVIVGAIMLTGLACGAIFKPLERCDDQENERTPLLKENESESNTDTSAVLKQNETERNKKTSVGCCSGICDVCKKIFIEMFDPKFLKSPVTFLMVVSYFLFTFGYHVPYTYTPDRAGQFGVDKTSASFLVSIMGISNVGSRLLIGWLGDRSAKIRFWLAGIVLTLGGVLSILIFLFNTHALMIVYCVFFGGFSGCWTSLGPVVVVDVVGKHNLEKALGLTFTVGSIGFLVASPMSGWIIDITDSFDVPFYVVGTMQTIGGVLFFLIACIPKPYYRYDDPIADVTSKRKPSYVSETFA